MSYAHKGWRVIPVWWVTGDGACACRRGAECTSAGKHPVHDKWPEIGTASFDQVADWWGAAPETGPYPDDWYPRANVGIVTGAGSGIFVLDIDPGHEGDITLATYERQHGEMPATRIHQTGGGGLHYFFRHPGFDVRNSAGKVVGNGLDIRGENGFVVAPPSISTKGAYFINPAHEVITGNSPEWLLDILRVHDKRQMGEVIPGTEPTAGTGHGRRYAEAALQAEAEMVRDAPAGERNNALNEAAFSLGTLGGAGLLEEQAAWTALNEAALAAGLSAGEIAATFRSGWQKGLESPRQIAWKVIADEWPQRDRTEFGLADRMADHWGDELRWCPERNVWMLYAGGCWTPGFKESGTWYAQQMIRRLAETEALQYDDEQQFDDEDKILVSPRELFLEWAAKQRTRKAVNAASDLCRGLPLMRVREHTFDLDPLMLNHLAGIVDLRTGEITPHDPEQRMTMQCPVSLAAQARAPRWQAFLERVQPDPLMRAYLHRVMGYTISGLVTEQAIFFHHGSGANGKSVFHAICSAVLGNYSQVVPVETLLATKMEGRIPNDVARMKGRRYLMASETKAGKALDEQMVKQLTGGDTMSARYMRAEWFEFKPTGKIHITTNHLLQLSDDDATWRRLHLIKWEEVIPEAERDPNLAETIIREEGPGVLAWLVQGAIHWNNLGLRPPDKALHDKALYRKDEDLLGQFIFDCLDEYPDDPQARCVGRSSAEIYAQWKYWATARGHNVMSQKSLTGRLKDRGFMYQESGHSWRGFPTLQVRIGLTESSQV